MAELDSLDWDRGLSFVCHGVRIGIRVDDSSVLERIPHHLPPGTTLLDSPEVDFLYSLRTRGDLPSDPPVAPVHRSLHVGSTLLMRTTALYELLNCLGSALEFTVAIGARSELFVHAGVVGWQGRSIVLPGRSQSGKTTLVAALVRAGATYYSDEFAVLGGDGLVHPFPRLLSIRQAGGAPATRCPVEELGGRAGIEPLPMGLVVMAEYRPAAPWRPRALTDAQAVLGLLENTVLAQVRPQFALAVFRRAIAGASAIQVRRDEANQAARYLLDCDVAGPVSALLDRTGRRRAGAKLDLALPLAPSRPIQVLSEAAR
jgi:hypothetical protein